MNSKSGNEHAENFLLFIVVGGLVLAGVIYGAYLALPFVMFYLIPFVLVSLVVGVVLRFAGAPSEGIEGISKYRAVVVAYAVMLLMVGLVFFQNLERAKVLNAKRELTNQVVVDWPKLNNWYNDWRVRVYADAPFESLREKAQIGVVYDRLELGWIFLMSLFLGGPAFYYWLARNDDEEVHEIIEKIAAERVAAKNQRLAEKEKNLDQIINKNKAHLELKIQKMEQAKEELMAEIQSLKAKLEFAPEVPRPSEQVESSKKGVLDQDWL
jgi:hypothetical protein